MGSAMEIGIQMRNLLTSLIRACYRFVCYHPCFVCFLGFLIFLYRWFPFALSILISMSPVLVCTGVLLGTLLFFGQFNIPEVEKGKKFTDGTSSFQTGFSKGATVIAGRDEYTSIIEERSIEETSLVGDKVNKVDENDGLLSLNVPVVDKNSLNTQHEKQVKKEMGREVHEEKEESSDLGSDDIESSSPDASMADIIPVLDELHPLLDREGPQPAHSSRGGSGIAFEKSQKSDDGSVESDEDTEVQGYEEDETESGIEDESKSAIRWTEDDQKNLMDLRSLELERNQRLENLIARRRAWRQMTEKNLIDLESTDIPSNVAPIATTRRNPFDFPDDSYATMGLPPIPGSAPSILHPRKNPFDIPFDSNEEKPVPKGDSPREEFQMFNQKDTFFRRHESFSLGPSVLGMTKHERQDIYWKPIFVSEQMASEGTSYSSFQRQPSEVSDSKLSSVPETESVSSTDQDERMSNEQDLPQETESVSTIDHVSGHVERGSPSSGEVDSMEMIPVKQRNVHRDEVEIVLGGVENPSETKLYSEIGEAAIHEEFNIGETHLRREVVDEESSSKSSRSSLSEVIDNIRDEKQEKSASVQQGEKNHRQKSRILTQASVEDSDFQFVSSEVEENQHREPVYDSSPPAARKLQSFYSIYFDSATEFFERTLPPDSVETTANVTDKKSELHDQRENDKTSGHEEYHSASSQPHLEQGDSEHQDLDKKAGSLTSNCQYVQSEVKPPSDLENNLSSSDKSVATPSINDHNESQVEFIRGVSISDNAVGEFYDATNKFHLNISSVTYDSSETPEFKSPTGESPRNVKKAEVEQGIPVLEGRSVEDIDLAFKQLQEGADVEEVILPSMIKDRSASEKSKAISEANSDLQVVEARSLDDINVAFELISEGNEGKLPKSLDLKDGSVKVEANEVVEFFDVEPDTEGINKIPVDNSEDVPMSSSNNEAKSQSKRLSSSSSSSSSDSD